MGCGGRWEEGRGWETHVYPWLIYVNVWQIPLQSCKVISPKMRQALGPGALGRPGESGWRGRWKGGSGWGTHVNPWPFHFNV